MFQFLALIATLNAPALDAQCVAWTKAPKATAKQSKACMDHFLTHAYGRKADAEALSLDPFYGQRWEIKVTTTQLQQALAHVGEVCKHDDSGTSKCGRTREFFNGLIDRRMSTFENVGVGSFEGPLAKVLKGEKLTEADLAGPEPGVGYSALTLWRLRNAAYARHGYSFKTTDLNAFFYDDRPPSDETKLLPVAAKGLKKVQLTAIDGANVRLIKAFEAKLK